MKPAFFDDTLTTATGHCDVHRCVPHDSFVNEHLSIRSCCFVARSKIKKSRKLTERKSGSRRSIRTWAIIDTRLADYIHTLYDRLTHWHWLALISVDSSEMAHESLVCIKLGSYVDRMNTFPKILTSSNGTKLQDKDLFKMLNYHVTTLNLSMNNPFFQSYLSYEYLRRISFNLQCVFLNTYNAYQSK